MITKKQLRDWLDNSERTKVLEQMEKVASNISLWGEIDFEEKRFTVDKMIRSLKVFPGSVQIQWKF